MNKLLKLFCSENSLNLRENPFLLKTNFDSDIEDGAKEQSDEIWNLLGSD